MEAGRSVGGRWVNYKLLALVGVVLMVAPSLYINVGSVRESNAAFTGSIILPPGGAAAVEARIDGDNGRIIIVYAGNDAQVAVTVQGPQGTLATRVVSGNATIDLSGLPGSAAPYRIIFYNPGTDGTAEAGVLVVAAYDAPLYTSTDACQYLLLAMVGAIIAGYSVGRLRSDSRDTYRESEAGLESPGAH